MVSFAEKTLIRQNETPALHLDLILVPSGLLLMLIYHVYLVWKIIRRPNSTVIGFENGNIKVWVRKMMQDSPKNTSLALQVVSNNITASTYMSTISITLSSLIGTIVGISSSSSIPSQQLNNPNKFIDDIVFGNRSAVTWSLKYVSLLLCFLTAFMAFVQSIRYYIHINFLISTPMSAVPVEYVERSVIRGSNFWSLGIRAYYFAFPLLLWIIGPIPMFVCCLGMLCFLWFLDSTGKPIAPFGTLEPHEKSLPPLHAIAT